MTRIRNSLDRWFQAVPEVLGDLDLAPTVEHMGEVAHVGDGVATIIGLPTTRSGELLLFENGSHGLAFSVSEDEVGCVMLSGADDVVAGHRVRGTGDVARVPVGEGLLGRIVDSLGNPLDDGPAIVAERRDPIERPAPAIVDRAPVTEPLMTGVTVVDAMVPLGRGQRELIIGDRKTGKTALAIDTVINQRSSDVICIYAMIGQKASTAQQIIAAIREHGAVERCIFVIGESSAPPGSQWIAPYAACAMAEYFRDTGRHALLILDDLTKHAIVYRELSLLLRRPPGREAYPGDIFYIHSRLLERAAKLSAALGGGSITALPIAETQAGNLSAYVPTNLISITDGQIYFEPKLFYEGQKPAVNVGLSVSRVGGKTQPPVIKHLAERLKLDYAQFLELEVFTRFGAMVDDRTRQHIEHGRRIRAILSQPQFRPLPIGEEAGLLLAVKEGRLDTLPLEKMERFKAEIGPWLERECPEIMRRAQTSGKLEENDFAGLLESIAGLVASMSADKGAEG